MKFYDIIIMEEYVFSMPSKPIQDPLLSSPIIIQLFLLYLLVCLCLQSRSLDKSIS